jgi:hypothetical protein
MLHALDLRLANLEDLEAMFSDEEVWAVVKEMAPDRAPGPMDL